MPLGRKIREKKPFRAVGGPLTKKKLAAKKKKKKEKSPQKLGHRGSRETDFPSGKGCLRVIGFARVASIINK